jgi:hypothetical protein
MKTEKKQRPLWKTILIFGAVILACVVLGFLVGSGMAMAQNVGLFTGDLTARVQGSMVSFSTVAYIALWVVSLVICAFLYYKAKRIAVGWDGQSEEAPEKADRLLSYYVILTNVLMILSWLLFSLFVWGGAAAEEEDPGLAFILLFVVSNIALPFIQRAAVQLVKKINPEKQGEVLDFHFQKDWVHSMDEMEKAMLYKASYVAFRATTITCMALWLVCIIGEVAFSWSLIPAVLVAIIWLVSMLAFQIEAFRLEHKTKK